MSTVESPPLMTAAEFLALPENDGIDRWLIRGQLREREMTYRNRFHSRLTSRLSYLLESWLESQSMLGGEIAGGEAGFRLTRDPESVVGVDVAYVGPDVSGKPPSESTIFDGPPVLAVEILSPSDQAQDVDEKIEEYLRCGVKIVWIVDPRFQTITVYRPDAEPVLFNRTQTIAAEPHLPGFSVPVASIFG